MWHNGASMFSIGSIIRRRVGTAEVQPAG